MRFPVEARVVYKWVDELGVCRDAEGRTVNVSERGALISSLEAPIKGSRVEIKLFLPSSPNREPAPILMEARVVRTEEKDGQDRTLFAVEGHEAQPIP